MPTKISSWNGWRESLKAHAEADFIRIYSWLNCFRHFTLALSPFEAEREKAFAQLVLFAVESIRGLPPPLPVYGAAGGS